MAVLVLVEWSSQRALRRLKVGKAETLVARAAEATRENFILEEESWGFEVRWLASSFGNVTLFGRGGKSDSYQSLQFENCSEMRV